MNELCTLQMWKVNSKHFLNVEKAHKKVIICKIMNIQASTTLSWKIIYDLNCLHTYLQDEIVCIENVLHCSNNYSSNNARVCLYLVWHLHIV